MNEHRHRCRITEVLSPTGVQVQVSLDFDLVADLPMPLLAVRPPVLRADRKAALAWLADWVDEHRAHSCARWPFEVESSRALAGWAGVFTCRACGAVLGTEMVRAGRGVPVSLRSVVKPARPL